MTEPAQPPRGRPLPERLVEMGLFRARWLMAPFYIGLVAALVDLLVVYVSELVHGLANLPSTTPEKAILLVLSLIDMSLAGNLLLIVIYSGYENFVSKIQGGKDEDWPSWMGTVDFSGLKMKLISSIVAISAVALLRVFMELAEGENIDARRLTWLLALHLSFVISGVLFAITDKLASTTAKH
jgi:uncharacterized protein (TIGR00645 family)